MKLMTTDELLQSAQDMAANATPDNEAVIYALLAIANELKRANDRAEKKDFLTEDAYQSWLESQL